MDRVAFETFHRDGFLVVPGFLSETDIADMKSELRRLHNQFLEAKSDESTKKNVFVANNKQDHMSKNHFMESSDRITFFFEKNADQIEDPLWKINKVGHALHDKSEPFKKISFRKSIHDMCKNLMKFDDPTIVQSMYIVKPPRIGGEVSPHQDESYISVKPKKREGVEEGDEEIMGESSCIGFWMALDDATTQNACLWAIPGSHKPAIQQKWVRMEEDTEDDKLPMKFISINPENPYFSEEMKSKYVPLEVKAGDLVILHGRVLHQSFDNTSEKAREAYTLHIVDREEYEASNWLQRNDGFPSFWQEE